MRSYRAVVDENVRLRDENKRLRLDLADATDKLEAAKAEKRQAVSAKVAELKAEKDASLSAKVAELKAEKDASLSAKVAELKAEKDASLSAKVAELKAEKDASLSAALKLHQKNMARTLQHQQEKFQKQEDCCYRYHIPFFQ